MLALRLPPEIEARLDALAKRTGRTKSYYAREAILVHIEDLEDAYLADQRIRSDTGERISLEDVMAEYADDLAANPPDEQLRPACAKRPRSIESR
jgi:RHH-type transcriptional regulator, rel operon repressor / antitoxin RelB